MNAKSVSQIISSKLYDLLLLLGGAEAGYDSDAFCLLSAQVEFHLLRITWLIDQDSCGITGAGELLLIPQDASSQHPQPCRWSHLMLKACLFPWSSLKPALVVEEGSASLCSMLSCWHQKVWHWLLLFLWLSCSDRCGLGHGAGGRSRTEQPPSGFGCPRGVWCSLLQCIPRSAGGSDI